MAAIKEMSYREIKLISGIYALYDVVIENYVGQAINDLPSFTALGNQL